METFAFTFSEHRRGFLDGIGFSRLFFNLRCRDRLRVIKGFFTIRPKFIPNLTSAQMVPAGLVAMGETKI